MSGPRNNLEEIRSRINTGDRSYVRPVGKPRTESFKFKSLASENVPSGYPPLNSSKSTKLSTQSSLHTQFTRSEISSTSFRSIGGDNSSPPKRTLKRSSPESTSSSNKRLKVDNPLGTSNRINTSEPKSVDGFSSSDIQAPKSLRPIITSTERPSRQQTPQRRSPPNKPSRLDQLSMDRLVKLKSSRQQKTIDHADHLLARLKRRDDEDLDLDLIEKQYDLLKSSVKEVEEAILRRRGAENSLTSPGLSTSSASPAIQINKATGMTLRSPESSSSTTVHPPYFNFRSTAIRADISTGDTTISSTISTVSAVTASTMLSSPIKNGTPFRVSRTMDKVDEEEVLWAGMGEFDHNIFQTQRESPERRQKKSNEAEKGPAPIAASGLSPETESSKYRGHPSYIEALTVLRNTFGKEEFRRHQLTAIMETLAGKDVFQSALLG
ncbi:hypothetical protein FRC14_007604 [Serendipita sp. 396]|nr:hypothetical protein FRC14_007604 [Serendipita sp. 396]